MKKGILITIIGIIIIGISYFGIEMYGFAKGVKEDAKKENLNAELNAQTQFSGYPTSDKVEFNIKAGKEYYAGEPIEIKLIWKNESDKNEKIMIRDYWGHPIGTGASIMDLKNVELTSQISSHILSSQLFSPDDLKEYEIELKPNETKEYSVDLLKIPILKQTESNLKSTLPKGKYKIQVFYPKVLVYLQSRQIF
ncbi:hypothetical protein QSV08_15385 [Maribacter sp. BPC-D8]|uniref:hypothetical protein n=1 Tax=Maribacter sp. BPC-D8 TaxID=3053613 RepID=UPI002B479692|nr:hypothetical protein [Maribacter sp. BPC-D8]WRI28598.1 hypothetical protein QSV08_15385 [Maribacter sp. BPC-D8]